MIIFIDSYRKVGSYEFWITAILKSGKKINVFISNGVNFQNIIKKKIECLISAFLIRKIESETDLWNIKRLESSSSVTRIITGDYIHNYKIPSQWSKVNMISLSALKTIDGIFLLDFSDSNNNNFKDGQEITIHVGRFNLIDWHHIE